MTNHLTRKCLLGLLPNAKELVMAGRVLVSVLCVVAIMASWFKRKSSNDMRRHICSTRCPSPAPTNLEGLVLGQGDGKFGSQIITKMIKITKIITQVTLVIFCRCKRCKRCTLEKWCVCVITFDLSSTFSDESRTFMILHMCTVCQ